MLVWKVTASLCERRERERGKAVPNAQHVFYNQSINHPSSVCRNALSRTERSWNGSLLTNIWWNWILLLVYDPTCWRKRSFLDEIQAVHTKPNCFLLLFRAVQGAGLKKTTGVSCCQNEPPSYHLSLLETLILAQFIFTALWQTGKTSVTHILYHFFSKLL